MPQSNDTGISGLAIAGLLAGGILMYSAVKNIPLSQAIRSLVGGSVPVTPATPSDATAGGISGEHSGSGARSNDSNRALARFLATPYGWGIGQQWQALDNLWTRESGFQSNIMNPSGAFGIAQALGHGTASSTAYNVHVVVSQGVGPKVMNVNQYPNALANSGDPTSQILWGLDYIKGRYGDPITAWANETSQGSY